MNGRCWDRLARSSGLLYPAWVLSAVRRGKQRQFVCWIQVRSTDGKVKLARCLIDNGSEVNLVRKGFVSAASPICSDFQTFCPDWLHFGHFLCFGGIAASQLSHRIFPIYF